MEPRPAHLISRFTPPAPVAAPQRSAYRPREVAERHGLGLSTVYDALYRGELAGRKVGRSWVIPIEAIDAWLQGATPAPQ